MAKVFGSKYAKVKLATTAAAAAPHTPPPAAPDQRLSVYQQAKQSIQRHFILLPRFHPGNLSRLERQRENERETLVRH